ncbi:MAG: SMP-30/gluconolactonase/LRE family protein, partial [Bacteroidota bacterium]
EDIATSIIDTSAKIEIIAEGFTWTEGPLWIEDGQFLLFSDIPQNKVYKLDNQYHLSTFLHPSGYTGTGDYGDEPGSNALVLNQNQELVLLQHGDRRVAKMSATLQNPQPAYLTLVDNYKGKKLNSPNDGVYDRHGNFYFTDPPYGLPQKMDDSTKELNFQGVYFLSVTGQLTLLDSVVTKPNGIALSNDQTKLYVAVSDPKHAVWYQYDLVEPGQVTQKRIFYDATALVNQKGHQGLPDGMKVNRAGYLFATGPGGIWLFDKSGAVLAKIFTGQLTSNCALSSDEKTLFATADDYILKILLK